MQIAWHHSLLKIPLECKQASARLVLIIQNAGGLFHSGFLFYLTAQTYILTQVECYRNLAPLSAILCVTCTEGPIVAPELAEEGCIRNNRAKHGAVHCRSRRHRARTEERCHYQQLKNMEMPVHWCSFSPSTLFTGYIAFTVQFWEPQGKKMNSAEAAEEGPNDSDTDAFFKTGRMATIYIKNSSFSV